MFVGFVLFNSSKGWLPIAKTLLKIFSIFALYGIFTWILQSNPWYDFTASVYEQGSGMWSEVQDRGYRVNSFLNNPIAYSLVMGIGASTIWLYYLHKPNKTVLILLLLIVFNVFIANSRTGIVAFGLSIMIYILFYNGISLKTAYKILCAIVVAIILYFNVESIRPMIDAVADIFITGGNNTSGSNMELKDMQMATSLTYFGEAPIFGHGILYFKEDIQPRYGVMSGLAGLEGYGYRLLIEMGGIMIIAFIMYITKFCSIAIKGRYQCKSLASLAIAQFIAFIFFIMATGDYGNIFEYSLILIGINLKHLVCELKPSTKRKQQTIWRQKTYSV